MKTNKTKKGFTIVELVIVIAIIAILAAVLIPTFSNLIKRANVSKDQQLVRNLNTALIADAAINGKHQTMHDAVEALKASGFDVAKINDSKAAENEILWDSKNDLFCYLNDGKVEYLPENDRKYQLIDNENAEYNEDYVNYVDLFRVAPSVKADSPYSTYLYAYEGNEPIETTKGLDVGDEIVASITYVRNGTAQNVVIRTNSFETSLTIDAASDTVKHYGEVGSLNIIAVANASYHENGKVAFAEIKTGRIVLEEKSEVEHIHLSTSVVENETVFNNITVAKAENVEMPEFSRDPVEIPEEGKLVVALQNGTETTDDKDYVWLTAVGVYEQVTVSSSTLAAGSEYAANTGSAEQQKAAAEIANNITFSADGVDYKVTATKSGDGWTYEVVDEEGNKSNDYTAEKLTTKNTVEVKTNAETPVVVTTKQENGVTSEEKAALKEETVSTYRFNFVLTTDSLPLGEEFKFTTTMENVNWSVNDTSLAHIENDGTLSADEFDVKITVFAEYNGKIISHDVNLVLFHGGTGEENDPYEIYNRYQFEYMWYGYQEYGHKLYYELVNDIDFQNNDPHSYAYRGIHLEGNNHILINGAGPLFSQQNWTYDLYLSNFTIKNFTSDGSLICGAGAYNVTGKQIYDNIDVIDCVAKGGAFFLPWVYENYDITFKNCDIKNSTVNNDVTCQGYVAGFVGNGKSTVTIDNCTMQANITSSNPIVAGIIGSGSATVQNCSILPGTTITQKGSSSASAIGSATITNTTCFATIIKSTNSDVYKNGFDNTVAYLAQDLGFNAENFIVNSDGSVEYTGSVEIAKLEIYQKVTTDRLHDGEFENGGFPTPIGEKVTFNNVFSGTYTDSVNYITNVKNVTNQVADKLYCSIEELPIGLEFNEYGFVFDNGTLYLDANQAEDVYTSNYFAGTLKSRDNVNSIKVTVFFVAYDANNNLLGTFTTSYSLVLEK